jgi:hypothetical protein
MHKTATWRPFYASHAAADGAPVLSRMGPAIAKNSGFQNEGLKYEGFGFQNRFKKVPKCTLRLILN